ncbi:MAG: glycerol kinase [Planctomycetota bacterium]
MVDAYLALDQGTTSSRAVVYDAHGRVLGQAQRELTQHFPGPGCVEHDPDEIFASCVQVLGDAWAAAGRPPVRALGITNQRETVTVFERATGKPIHRAIVWQDRRTAATLAGLRAHAELVRARAGLPLDPYFSAAKIAWILDRVEGARARAESGELAAATVDAWLVYRLTGGRTFATEPSNASRTSLFDLHTGAWSDELCDVFRVPRALLPEVRPSNGDFGRCDPALVGGDFEIRGILGDQQAALFGHGGVRAGACKCTYGTGAFMVCNVGDGAPQPHGGLLATVAWRLGDRTTYALEGSILVAGAVVQWLRDGLGLVAKASDVEALARSVGDSGGVVFVPAFAGLGTPDWDPHARGLIIGLERGTTRAHLARAALEAIALQVRDLQLALETSLGRRLTALRVDGGASANDLLLELQAGVSDLAVERPDDLEATARGAFRMAMLAATGDDLDTLPGATRVVRTFAPAGERAVFGELHARWRRAVERARGWAATD